MSIEYLKNSNGEVTSVRAIAGKVLGRKVQSTFRVRIYGTLEKALKAAEKWQAAKRVELDKDRHSVIALPDQLRHEVIECMELLEPYGVRLRDAVEAFVRTARARTGEPWTFRQASDYFIQSRIDKKARPEYLRSLEDTYGLVAKTFGDRLLDDITTEELETWLRSRGRVVRDHDKKVIYKRVLAPATWRNYRRDIGMVFTFAADRDHALKNRNPAKLLAEPIDEDRPVQILTVEQTRKLLYAAEPIAQVYIAIGCFAGIRPFESLKLSQLNIDIVKATIYMEGPNTKSRKRGLVKIAPNLAEWLQLGSAHVGQAKGYWSLRRMITRAAQRSGVTLTADVFRHSFASHYLALHEDAAQTAHQLRHRSQQMLFAHYRDVVTPEDGKAYFEIRPAPPP